MVEVFAHTPEGDPVYRVTLRGGGLTAKVITWGASLQDLRLDGVDHRLTLGSETLDAYLGPLRYCGAIVGRVANRIAGGQVTLDGRTYDLDRNEADRTTLHGGRTGTAEVNWRLVGQDDASCRMALTLANGQDGFPGQMEIVAEYRLDGDGCLSVTMEARTDAPTFCNLAHHGYWSLDGAPMTAAHSLTVPAETYLPVDAQNIPLGAPEPVAGTRFDYRTPRPIFEEGAAGLDHSFCLDTDGQVRRMCLLEAGSVRMEVLSDQPGLQVYDGRHFDPAALTAASAPGYGPYAGVALEPQGWPDAPNRPNYPSVALRPGETYMQETRFQFGRV